MIAKQNQQGNRNANGQQKEDCAKWRLSKRLSKAFSLTKTSSRQRISRWSSKVVNVQNGKDDGEKARQNGSQEKGKEGKIVASSNAGI